MRLGYCENSFHIFTKYNFEHSSQIRIVNNMTPQITNEEKAKLFYKWLGERFKTFEIASENAPISFLAKDEEDKEYFIHVQIANEPSVKDREQTGIKIANTQFYHLYAMASQGSNVFWFELFDDGFMLFYINDCLTPEQLKVTDEFTMIGIASALHVELPVTKIDSEDGKTYYTTKPVESTPIVGSLQLPKTKVIKKKKR